MVNITNQQNENGEETNKLFAEAGINLNTRITYGVVLKLDFYEIKALNDFVRDREMFMVYRKASPNKLYICTEKDE